ncbi:MAG TPA: saccharopine dehydrogenase NADP-binding domain-containing protein, partial [Candidatus Limnocylindrales bacterium]
MRPLKVLMVGVGTVGEAIAVISRERPWIETMVLADYDLERATRVQARVGGGDSDSAAAGRFPVERIDARDQSQVVALARKHGVDLIMNAADPRFIPAIFDGAFEAGVGYLDMATSLSEPHPTDPFNQVGVPLADHQFPKHEEWQAAGRLAILGTG